MKENVKNRGAIGNFFYTVVKEYTRIFVLIAIVLINGKQGKKSSKLQDGDEVCLMSPVCGG